MKTLPALTLTEMLVVLAIMGLVAALAFAGTPTLVERARLDTEASQLGDDLALAAMRARGDAAFGALTIAPDHEGYVLHVGGVDLRRRALPGGVRLDGDNLSLDPAGRWSAGEIVLEGHNARIRFSVDPLTDARYAPAMALLEALTGAAILAAALLSFLAVLTETHADLSRARASAEIAALAQTLLLDTKTNWLTGPTQGATSGITWERHCLPAPASMQARLLLVRCDLTLQQNDGAIWRFETAWAEPRPDLLAP